MKNNNVGGLVFPLIKNFNNTIVRQYGTHVGMNILTNEEIKNRVQKQTHTYLDLCGDQKMIDFSVNGAEAIDYPVMKN